MYRHRVKRLENFDSTVLGADFEMSLDSTCSTQESLAATIQLVHMTCSDEASLAATIQLVALVALFLVSGSEQRIDSKKPVGRVGLWVGLQER